MKYKNFMNLAFGIITIFYLIIYFFVPQKMALFFICTFLMGLILIICKLSILSIKCTLVYYVLIPLFFKEYLGIAYGNLSITPLEIYFKEATTIIYIYLSVNFLLCVNTNFIVNEKNKRGFIGFKDSYWKYILSILAVIFIIIYYPPAFLNSTGERFYHLLPGNFWNHLSIVCLLLCLPEVFKSKLVTMSFLFVIAWCIFRNERVDAIGLLAAVGIYLMFNKKIRKGSFLIISLFILLYLSYMGVSRIGNTLDSNTLISQILIQSTSSDIGSILNMSINYNKIHGCLFGKTYLSYIYEFIPFEGFNYNPSRILNETFGHPGGIHYLAEPFMNFSYIGVLVFSIVEGSIFNSIVRSKRNISNIYYYFLVAASFRYVWYGLEYIENAVILFIPILVFIAKKIKIYDTVES